MALAYIDSSDDEASPATSTGQAKSTPYAPPRLTVAAKPSPGRFQLPTSKSLARASAPPTSRNISVSSSSGRPTPAPENASRARSTTGVQQGLTLNSRDNTAELAVLTSNISGKLGSDKVSRPSLVLERQVNELASTFEEFRSANNKNQKEVQSVLASILATSERLEAKLSRMQADADMTFACGVPTPTPPPIPSTTHSTCADAKPLMSNPPVTPGLAEVVTRVVSEARSQVGKKKFGADENSCKDHARKSFYRMLNISAAGLVRSYFEDTHGEPDTLPAQFVDPDTLYCQPYPHWGLPLTRQVAWIPTYIARFKATIPNNQTELAKTLQDLSDEQIITLLNDGPFKTACAAWRLMKKTDEELKQMRSESCRYQRGERKVSMRSRYIQNIPALQSPEWAFLYHSGYMSTDESDDEGDLVTKIPSTRSQWVTNLYHAINVAEHLHSKGKFTPPCNSQIVEAPVPHMERGTGSARVIVRISTCAISKSWRASHPEIFAKFAHLVNGSETNKPNILEFLERYPLSLLNRNKSDILVKEEVRDVRTGSEEHGTFRWEDTAPIDYDGDEESGVILEVLELNSPKATGPEIRVPEDDIPIDPELLGELAHSNGPLVVHSPRYKSSPLPSEEALQEILNPSASMPHDLDDFDMPPPPLPLTSQTSPHTAEMPPPPPWMSQADRNQATSTCQTSATSANQVEGEASSEVPPRKRRGRPPGSKNKKQKMVN